MLNGQTQTRIQFVFGFFVLLFLLILGKAVKVQLIDRSQLLARAERQFFRQRKIYPKRGSIYDRKGDPLAINIQTYSLFVIPKSKQEDLNNLRKLAAIVPQISYQESRKKINERKKFTWLARKIELSQEQIDKIKKLETIHIEAVPKRLYPNNELLGQVLGFVGVDNSGLAGIEYLHDEILKGSPKLIKYAIDNKGRPISFESETAGDLSEDLYLSIDKDIQAVVEKNLKDTVLEFNALRGGVGVIDVETGEILAMANYPSYDPNHPHQSPQSVKRLPFISDPFEPGSTFKLLTVASALEHNVARADTNYYCEKGKFEVQGHIISEADANKVLEWLSVGDIVKYSSNIGTTKIAFDLTFPRLRETLLKFGVGQKTGIELPGESRGIFTNETKVSPLSLSNISFGQGVATTGLQMLTFYAAIANGGYAITPTIFKRKPNEEIKKTRILSDETVASLTQMLIHAVEEGTGENAKIDYFTIAGKTSTAQKSDETGQYNGHIPGFVGFPVNVQHRFAIYVYVDTPAKGLPYYGNLVAAPIFQRVAKFILFQNKEYKKVAYQDDFENQLPQDRVQLTQSSTRYLGQGVAPNLIGLDKKSVLKLGEDHQLSIDHKGVGVVDKQVPAPGSPLQEGEKIQVFYRPPQYE